jgi:uncharacterized protein
MSNESFVSNPPERCFFCKDELFKKIRRIAEGLNYPIIFDGSNSDDLRDYRPGRKAASLHGVLSPLAEFGFTKEEIRLLSKDMGLPCWNKPSSPCLSSRFPYGQRITTEGLSRVEKAEDFIRGLGVGDIRVRSHGDIARIEAGDEGIEILASHGKRRLVSEKLRSFGYRFVSLDLDGYRSGSMNRTLQDFEN